MSEGDLINTVKGMAQSLSYLVQTYQRQGPGAFGNVGSNINTTVSPNTYGLTIGTTSMAGVVPANPARVGLIFQNCNQTAVVAVCTPLNAANATTQTAAVYGAGSITILPLTDFRILGLRATTSWNAVASTTAALTVLEFV
jgi:hypothetical protein